MAEHKPVWTIVKIIEWTKQYFKGKGVENPRLDAEVLLCDVLKCSRLDLYTHFDQPLEEEELKKYRTYVMRRAQREPLAYILGKKAFLQYEFKVTPATLVPRPETELLVEQVVKLNKAKQPREILDIGCGSGAILVSLLAQLQESRGLGLDISSEAVEVTLENAQALGVQERCAALVSDLFAHMLPDDKFNVIVSNPPYIPSNLLATLDADVRKEPKAALDGGKDGLDFYRKILAEINQYLLPEGMLALEIGINQGAAVKTLCQDAGFAVVNVQKDYAGIDRLVFATKEGSCYADEIMAIRIN